MKISLKEYVKKLNDTILWIVFVAAFCSILMFCFQIGFEFVKGSTTLRQGFLENRLFGVYTSPNVGALFALISIVLMIINSCLKTGKAFKWNWKYIVNAIFQFVYFSLTLSKGGTLTVFALVFACVVIYSYPYLKSKYSTIKSILTAFVLFGVLIVVLQVNIKLVRQVMAVVPNVVRELVDDSKGEEGEETEEEKKVKFERIEEGDDMSNGRLTIWSGGVELWKQSPILGVADAKIYEDENVGWKYNLNSMSKAEKYWMHRCGGNMHNSYLQILVLGGILNFGIFILFAILMAKKYIIFLVTVDNSTLQYKVIGGIACLIGVICVNGMVENHILYNHQDPYGAIFWFYLGLGSILIKKYTKTSAYKDYLCRKSSAKFAFVCDTPLQILNVANFVENDVMDSKEKSDLYIVHQFRNSMEISEEIKKNKIFNKVYDVKPFDKQRGVFNKLFTLKRLFCPKHMLSKQMISALSLDNKNYRYLGISFQSPITITMRMAYCNSDVILIEDGIGSYIGNIEKDYLSNLYKIINKYFMENRGELDPISMYVNCPRLSSSKISCPIKELPKKFENNAILSILEKIFQYKSNDLYCENIVWLTQPLNEVYGYNEEKECEVLEIIKKHFETRKKEVVVRLHPRQKDYDVLGLKSDTGINLWELECIHEIGEKNILISAFSTALFMPKILLDKEPILIFVYKLVFESLEKDARLLEYSKLIQSLKNAYVKKERIYVPNSFREFIEILESLE